MIQIKPEEFAKEIEKYNKLISSENKLILGRQVIKIKKIEVRCANCNRKLFIGSPGFDIKNGESRTIEIKCPRCNHINIANCEIFERVVVRLKD